MFYVIIQILIIIILMYIITGFSFLLFSFLYYGKRIEWSLGNIIRLVLFFPKIDFEEE